MYEIDRLATPAAAIVDELAGAIGLVLCAEPFHAVVAEAERQSWTRDPFDRLIVAQSAYSGSTWSPETSAFSRTTHTPFGSDRDPSVRPVPACVQKNG